MKKLNYLIFLVLVAVGVNLSASCYTLSSVPVVQVNKVYEYTTKKVPYKVCEDVCVVHRDACNCRSYTTVKKVCKTKYRTVTVKKFKGYENVGYYKGQRISILWPRKLCKLPIKIEGTCCTVVRSSCSACVAK